MDKTLSLNDWLIDNSVAVAAKAMIISPQAVYKMIESGRDVRVSTIKGKFKFTEIKELN